MLTDFYFKEQTDKNKTDRQALKLLLPAVDLHPSVARQIWHADSQQCCPTARKKKALETFRKF